MLRSGSNLKLVLDDSVFVDSDSETTGSAGSFDSGTTSFSSSTDDSELTSSSTVSSPSPDAAGSWVTSNSDSPGSGRGKISGE